MNSVPKWARGVLKDHDFERLSKAVHKAESLTTGEFVVCVVRRSSGVGHTAYAAALFIFAVLLMASSLTTKFGYYGNPLGAWLLEAGIAAILGYFAGQATLVQRLFTFVHERQLLVYRRACLEFHQNHLEKTKGATGVLLFVSLMERQAVVLADKSIATKLAPAVWESVLKKILEGVKHGDLGEGLAGALELSSGIVAPHFPCKGKNKNELSDRLIIKE